MAGATFTDKSIERVRSIDHDNLLDYLSSAYEVLRKIFSYLSLEELEIVSEAFKKWRPVVETTKKERTVIDSFVFSHKEEDCKMWSEANFCITFCMKEDKNLEQKLRKHLLYDVEFIVVESAAGVIGTPSDCSQLVQQKMFRSTSPTAGLALATHLRLPDFPDVGVKTFSWYKNMSFGQFRDAFHIPQNKTIKCLLILITYEESNRYQIGYQKDDFVTFLQTIQSESFAVGGCVVDSFLNDKEAITKYIVFYGDKVEAASIVLEQDVRTKERIDSKVEELKGSCPKTEKGVVFVFRCCSRNKMCKQPKIKKKLTMWEGDALTKYFPSTPIVGCYGYGEFGRKFPSNDNVELSSKRPRQLGIWEYSLSTSIVYVGFKK